jgi:hypothetical protein
VRLNGPLCQGLTRYGVDLNDNRFSRFNQAWLAVFVVDRERSCEFFCPDDGFKEPEIKRLTMLRVPSKQVGEAAHDGPT